MAPFMVRIKFSLLMAKENSARFIVSTFAFLRALENIVLDGSTISFDVMERKIIGLGKRNEYFANAIEGKGSFEYTGETISNLIKCLRSIGDQPITVIFSDYIYLRDLMF